MMISLCTAMFRGRRKQRKRERGKYVEHIKKSRFPLNSVGILRKTSSAKASNNITVDKGKRKVRVVRPTKVPERNIGGSSTWSPPGDINDRFRCIIEYTPNPAQSDELFVSSGDIFTALEFYEDNW
jgi:hypothetical protein